MTPLLEGKRQFPVLQLGDIADRVVLGLATPSRMAILVSMSRSSIPITALLPAHLAIGIEDPEDSRGRLQGTALTACCVKGPTPTESKTTIQPRSAEFLKSHQQLSLQHTVTISIHCSYPEEE